MRTISLSEAEAQQLRGAAWGYWQRDRIGDEPSVAELGEHAERAQLVASLLDAAEARACAPSPALLERLAAYESEVAAILEQARLKADRRVWEAALGTVRGLLARLREAAQGDIRCESCGLRKPLNQDKECAGCEERSLSADTYAAEAAADLLRSTIKAAAEYVAILDLRDIAADAIDHAAAGRGDLHPIARLSTLMERARTLRVARLDAEAAHALGGDA